VHESPRSWNRSPGLFSRSFVASKDRPEGPPRRFRTLLFGWIDHFAYTREKTLLGCLLGMETEYFIGEECLRRRNGRVQHSSEGVEVGLCHAEE
jgi:hypothetical protein